MEQNGLYKQTIIDFIEGRLQPEEFIDWLENDPQVLDWLQSMIVEDKTMQIFADEKLDYFLIKLPAEKYAEINSEYQLLCYAIEADSDDQFICAKKVVNILSELDQNIVKFDSILKLVIQNIKAVLDNPEGYKASYVKEQSTFIKELFEKTYSVVKNVPYDIKTMLLSMKTNTKLGTYVNLHSYLFNLMQEFFPNETINRDETLYQRLSFIMDVCPECILSDEVESSGIIDDIISQVPETLAKAKRKKVIKELIKKTFYIDGTKYPRWVQNSEWPMSASGKPMRFVEQRKKKSKAYDNILCTLFTFEDVETGDKSVIEQFT